MNTSGSFSILLVLCIIFGYVSAAALIHNGSPAAAASKVASEISANHLRAMAGRSKRASYGVLPGRLRFEEDNQQRVRRTFGETADPALEDNAVAAASDGTGEASLLAGLTTEQLYRMLDLLNRIENQEPVEASPHELATLNYLLQSYQN